MGPKGEGALGHTRGGDDCRRLLVLPFCPFFPNASNFLRFSSQLEFALRWWLPDKGAISLRAAGRRLLVRCNPSKALLGLDWSRPMRVFFSEYLD